MTVESRESLLSQALANKDPESVEEVIGLFVRDRISALEGLYDYRIIPTVISDELSDLSAIIDPEHPNRDFMTQKYLKEKITMLRQKVIILMRRNVDASHISNELILWQEVYGLLYPDFDFDNI